MNKLLIFIFLAFISCKKEVTEDKVKDTSSEILNSDELFQENLLNKPKFFLKYWEGMAYEDFIKVSQLLCDEGILDSYSLTYNAPETHFKYLIGNGDGLDVNPIFSKNNNQST